MALEQTVYLRDDSLDLSLEDAIKDFLLHQRSCRHSPNTIKHYERTLAHLSSFMLGEGLTRLSEIRPMHLRSYFANLQERFKPKTANGCAGDAKALFNFQEAEGCLLNNPARNVKLPKLDKTILPAFTKEEIQRLMVACAGKDSQSTRNRAIILLLLDSGIRLNELSSLKASDIDLATGVFKVLGKGNKERLCRISHATLKELTRYLRLRAAEPDGPLWYGKYGVMTRYGLSITIQKIGKAANVHCHPHKFRRTCALMMLRNGCDVFSIQYLLGHSDLTVLRRYICQTQTDYLTAHAKFGPVANL